MPEPTALIRGKMMQFKAAKTILFSVAVASLMAACATGVTIGSKPGDVPPQIVNDPKDPKSKVWDHPEAFGPVPAQLAAAGQAVCSSLDTKDVQFKAIGFHPKARDFNGNTLPNGGYYCVAK